jgi:hypothetical protein
VVILQSDGMKSLRVRARLRVQTTTEGFTWSTTCIALWSLAIGRHIVNEDVFLVCKSTHDGIVHNIVPPTSTSLQCAHTCTTPPRAHPLIPRHPPHPPYQHVPALPTSAHHPRSRSRFRVRVKHVPGPPYVLTHQASISPHHLPQVPPTV